MDDQAGKGRDFGSRRIQILPEFLKKRVSITIEKGDQAEEGNAYRSRGNVYFSQGDFPKAIEYHLKHLKIAKEIGDRAGEGLGYANLGNAYYSLGDF